MFAFSQWQLLCAFAVTLNLHSAILERVSAHPGTGAQSNQIFISFTTHIATNNQFLVETSLDLQRWIPASDVINGNTNAIQWQTTECASLQHRFYRISERTSPFTTTTAQGRLNESQPGAFDFTTVGGWKIGIDTNSMRLTDPSGANFFQLWGSVHENLNGKHLKDIQGSTRSFLLSDDTLITVQLDRTKTPSGQNSMGLVTFISIYDAEESHRIDMQIHRVVTSSFIYRYQEAEEPDGELAQFFYNDDGLRMENVIETRDDCTRLTPGVLHDRVPIAQTYVDTPSRVDDLFDDPTRGDT